MKNRMIPGLLLGISMWGVTANAAQSAITCDRECLRGKVTQLLYAFLKHDVSEIPVADTLRVTEDAVEKPLARVGLVRTVTRLRGFRQDIIDERAGVAGADVVVEESGAPVLLVVRLKVVGDKLTEVELVATRSAAEGIICGQSSRDSLESAQAAGRGVKRRRNSADLAAPGESVVREFLQRRTRFRAFPRRIMDRPLRCSASSSAESPDNSSPPDCGLDSRPAAADPAAASSSGKVRKRAPMRR
jgi:hypothetical protein